MLGQGLEIDELVGGVEGIEEGTAFADELAEVEIDDAGGSLMCVAVFGFHNKFIDWYVGNKSVDLINRIWL